MEEQVETSLPDCERQMQSLYQLMRRTLQLDLHAEPGPQLAQLLCEVFELEAVALYDADLHSVYQAGTWSADPSNIAQNVFHFESSDDDPKTGISRRVIRLDSVPVGSLVMRGGASPLTNSAIAALIAITFDRYRAQVNESRIEAERHAEQMRATVLDSLAHAYKTPLTAIRAASSGLVEMGRLSPGQAELVALIDEQASLLNELTTKLLTTARLEGEGTEPTGLSLQVERVEVRPLIEEVTGSVNERAQCGELRIELPAKEELTLCCDRRLIEMLLTQYIDNACKYSDAGQAITVKAERAGTDVLFSVHSIGPVIPLADRDRIFDRYYRSSSSNNRAAGTGIGLSVAKRAALAHGGSVWVSSDANNGTTFYAVIPDAQVEISSSAAGTTAPALQRSFG